MKVPDFLTGPAEEVAPLLLGWRLLSSIGGHLTEVEITEVEAYSQDDPASHTYRGERPSNAEMFGPAGRLYVYRSYGIHWCANVVCGPEGQGAAVLLRSARPRKGVEIMARRRGRSDNLTSGPGNLTMALGITGEHRGLNLFSDRSPLHLKPGTLPPRYVATPRIGITKATEKPWRFVTLPDL